MNDYVHISVEGDIPKVNDVLFTKNSTLYGNAVVMYVGDAEVIILTDFGNMLSKPIHDVWRYYNFSKVSNVTCKERIDAQITLLQKARAFL